MVHRRSEGCRADGSAVLIEVRPSVVAVMDMDVLDAAQTTVSLLS